MATLIGFKADQVDTALTSGKTFSPGDRAEDFNGKQYIYVKASAAIAQYDAVTFDETYTTTVAPLTTSNDARGDRIGVAPVAIASGSYGWLQIYGECVLTTKTLCVANVRLNTTTTALDDDGTASSMVADGIYLTVTNSATTATAATAAILNYPAVGATL